MGPFRMIDYYEPNLDLTLTGCGFLGIYYVGAVHLLAQIWPQKPYNRICGSSCGGVIGVLLVAGIRSDILLAESVNILRELNDLLKRPKFGAGAKSIIEIVGQSLERVLPQDAHKICSGKLGISITKLGWSLENKFVHEFVSRRDLIEAVLAGCYIPVWGGLKVPHFRGEKCVDGAYSDNTPKFKLTDGERETVSVRRVEICPFSGEIEVSPPDRCRIFMCKIMGTSYYANWDNTVRTNQAVIPWNPSRYKKYLVDGHRDMKEFVFKNNLVKCRECYEFYRRQQKTTPLVDTSKAKSSCLSCLRLLEKVDSLKVSDDFLKMIN